MLPYHILILHQLPVVTMVAVATETMYTYITVLQKIFLYIIFSSILCKTAYKYFPYSTTIIRARRPGSCWLRINLLLYIIHEQAAMLLLQFYYQDYAFLYKRILL